VYLARNDIRDQTPRNIPKRNGAVQCRQGIATFGGSVTLASAPDSA
jgi:hypothetical protein